MLNRFELIKNLSDIPKIKYTGYIWKSDNPAPEIKINPKDIFSDIGENPFIIEGYLYSESESQSISIKQIDGQYFISKIDLAGIDLKNLPDDIFAQHCYLSDPAIFKLNNDFKYIKFVEYWESKPDDLCAGMQVLQPARIAFIGFSKEECDAK